MVFEEDPTLKSRDSRWLKNQIRFLFLNFTWEREKDPLIFQISTHMWKKDPTQKNHERAVVNNNETTNLSIMYQFNFKAAIDNQLIICNINWTFPYKSIRSHSEFLSHGETDLLQSLSATLRSELQFIAKWVCQSVGLNSWSSLLLVSPVIISCHIAPIGLWSQRRNYHGLVIPIIIVISIVMTIASAITISLAHTIRILILSRQ